MIRDSLFFRFVNRAKDPPDQPFSVTKDKAKRDERSSAYMVGLTVVLLFLTIIIIIIIIIIVVVVVVVTVVVVIIYYY